MLWLRGFLSRLRFWVVLYFGLRNTKESLHCACELLQRRFAFRGLSLHGFILARLVCSWQPLPRRGAFRVPSSSLDGKELRPQTTTSGPVYALG